MKTLQKAIQDGDIVDHDIVWTILKRKDEKFGIYRKIECICRALDLDFDEVIRESLQDETGRVLDKPNRILIHDYLMEARGSE